MKDWTDIDPGLDAVFLPGKIHGCDYEVYILYLNDSANDGNGSFEIEVCDARRILELYEEVNGDPEVFFDLLPDKFQGEWYYCDNKPESRESFDGYVQSYFEADFIWGRDGGNKEEMQFLVDWAKKLNKEDLCRIGRTLQE